MKASFLRWWLILCLTLIAVVGLVSKGLFVELWDADFTKLSFLIIGIYTVMTVYLGFLKIKCMNPYYDRKENHLDLKLENCWFTADAMIALGMIGTVVGFIIMMGPAFESINLQDVDSTSEVIAGMAYGMSTALTTTLVGLICSLLSKVQLMNFEYGAKQV